MPREGVKFGMGLPQFPASVVELSNIVRGNEEAARADEEAGFNSVWVGDHLLHFPPRIVPEAWAILTVAALATKRVLLGTCVTDPHRYHPAILAQRLATLDQLSGGRSILGLGPGVRMNLEPFGIEWDKPVSKLVEFVEIMRRLWTGETFSYDGNFWRLKDAFLQVKPVQSEVPVYLAANSPRMLRLTGEMADGWLPLGLNPELYKKRLKLIEESARKAGRAPTDIDAGLYVITSIADRAEDAYKQLGGVKSVLVPEILKEAGYEVELPEELSSYSYLDWMPTRKCVELVTRYGEFVPREAVIDFSITGTTQDCIDKIEEFVDAGVRHFILGNAGPDRNKVRELYGKKIIPRFA
ncbi:MAG: LLM class flavin-dependent oxidoreductase [Aigarchaeota archaeon]|nr:LLM class flavin-dependent oxidoreductase [Aigarchaeota archaeon]MDH5703119.1 LLM class flavin-dependent oxidoreductase [Aigarchaeota archaeon]